MSRSVLVLANPIAGGGRARTLAPQLVTALQRRGCTAEVYFTQRGGDARVRAAAAGGEPWDALVAVGGDGTVNEVLNGMTDPSRPLAVLPVGTANVLACEYRLPRRPEDIAELVAKATPQPHPIGTAGTRRFLLFCGAGIDGAIVERLTAVRTGTLGKHKWLRPIAHVLRRWPQFALTVRCADGEEIDGLSSVLVTRVRNYGGWLDLVPGIDPKEPVLHALCFRQRRRRQWLWLGARGLCGGLRPSRELIVRRTTALQIRGEAPCQIDGDLGAPAPLDIGLLPQPARLFVPAGAQRR